MNEMDRQNEPRDNKMDELLDAALASYGAAEPLHGLEERVLGRLRDEPARRPWWIWGGVAVALAALVIAVVLLARPSEQRVQTPIAVEKQPTVVATPKQNATVAPPGTANPQPRAHRGPANTQSAEALQPRNLHLRSDHLRNQGQAPVIAAVAMGAALPRRDVFPTPAPPTEQEILLARYMKVTPRDEVLAQVNRKPLEFHEDPLLVPSTNTNPQKSNGMK